MGWLYVPALLGLSSGCASPSATGSVLCATSSATSSRRQSSRKESAERIAMRLSGMSLPHSTAQRLVDAWTLSRLGSLANRTAPSASDTTKAKSGRTLRDSLTSSGQLSLFLKTRRESIGGNRWPTCARSGTMRHGVVFPLLDGEQITDAPGRSYWPTPTAKPYGYNLGGAAGRVGKKRPSLAGLLGGAESPLFLEWMMGFPMGWTGGEFSATAWSRWLRRMRFAFFSEC